MGLARFRGRAEIDGELAAEGAFTFSIPRKGCPMMMDEPREIISSRSNKTIKYLKSLSLARNRQKEGRFIIEGIRMTEEILERRCCVRKLIISPHAAQNERAAMLVESAVEQGVEVLWVADRVVDYLSETKTSQGVMALVEPETFSEEDLGRDLSRWS